MLNEFNGWDDLQSDDDFFKDDINTDEEGNVIDAVIKDDIVATDETQSDDTIQSDPNKEPDLFAEDSVIVNAGEELPGDEPDDKIVDKTTATFDYLVEKGIIEYEAEEDKELTPVEIDALLEDSLDTLFDDKIATLVDDMDDDKKQVVQYLMQGGDLNKLVDTMATIKQDVPLELNMDLENEDNQILAIRQLMKQDEDADEEEIEAQIEFLKESGRLESFSKKKYSKWEANKQKADQLAIQVQLDAVKVAKQQAKKAKRETINFLNTQNELNGLSVSKEDKKIIPTYLNEKTIQLQNGSYISEFEKDLFHEIPKNQEALMQLAILMKNRNEDGTFNFEKVAKTIKSKVVKEVRDNVQRSKTSIPTKSTNKKQTITKSLADYFNTK